MNDIPEDILLAVDAALWARDKDPLWYLRETTVKHIAAAILAERNRERRVFVAYRDYDYEGYGEPDGVFEREDDALAFMKEDGAREFEVSEYVVQRAAA